MKVIKVSSTRGAIYLTPERLRRMFVGHDEVIVRIRFRGSTSGSRDGTFHWAGSLIEVARLRGQVVHTPAIRRSCLLPAGKDLIFNIVMHG